MENSRNERISRMIAAGIEAQVAVEAVNATEAIAAAKAITRFRDEYPNVSASVIASEVAEAANIDYSDLAAKIHELDTVAWRGMFGSYSDLDAEVARERDSLADALRYDRMTQAQYDEEFDLVNAYATIARDTGATLAQVREVAASLGRDNNANLSIDERVERGWITPSEAEDLSAAAGCELPSDIDARFAAYDDGVMATDVDDEPEVDDSFPMWLEYNDIEGLTAPMEFDDPYEFEATAMDAYGCDYNPE